MLGGVGYVNDDGMLNFDSCVFTNNQALAGNFMYTMNSDNPNSLDNIQLLGNNFNIHESKEDFVNLMLSGNYSSYDYLFDSTFTLALHINSDIDSYKDVAETLIMGAHVEIEMHHEIKCVGEQAFMNVQSSCTVSFYDVIMDDLTLVQLLEASYTSLYFYNSTFSNLAMTSNDNFFILLYVESAIGGSGLTLTNFKGQFLSCMYVDIDLDDVNFNGITIKPKSLSSQGAFL